jgi:hypothetical protein
LGIFCNLSLPVHYSEQLLFNSAPEEQNCACVLPVKKIAIVFLILGEKKGSARETSPAKAMFRQTLVFPDKSFSENKEKGMLSFG